MKIILKDLKNYVMPSTRVYDENGIFIDMVKDIGPKYDDRQVVKLYDGIHINTDDKSEFCIKMIKPWVKFIDPVDGKWILDRIERCGRICWQSEPKGNPEGFVRNLIKKGHTSVLEHVNITFEVMTDIATLIDWTRHRHASYSVESTRFVKYTNGMEFIKPIDITDEEQMEHFLKACGATAEEYQWMLDHDMKSDQGRTILNKSLRCNFVCTMNLRSLRNFFQLRCAKEVNPHFKEITIPMLMYLKDKIPVVFDDITYDENFYHEYIEGHENEYIFEEKESTRWLVDERYKSLEDQAKGASILQQAYLEKMKKEVGQLYFYKVTLDYKDKIKLIVQEVEGMEDYATRDLKKDPVTGCISCVVAAKDEIDAKKEGLLTLYRSSEKLGSIICRQDDENETEEENEDAEKKDNQSWYQIILDYRAEPKLTVQKVPSPNVDGPNNYLKVNDGSVSCIIPAKNATDAKRTGFRYFYLNSKETGVKLFRKEDIEQKLLLTLNCRDISTGIGMFDGNITLYKLLLNFNPRNYDPSITLFEEDVELFCCVRAFKQRDPKVILFLKTGGLPLRFWDDYLERGYQIAHNAQSEVMNLHLGFDKGDETNEEKKNHQ